VKAAQELLGTPTVAGGSAPSGGGGEGSLRRHLSPQPAEIYKIGAEKGQFPALFGLKIMKTPFFAQKYLIRYTPKMFFEEYINFTNFSYLRHCGVVPVQSLGSHIRLQPSELGLTWMLYNIAYQIPLKFSKHIFIYYHFYVI
jgi:hypothetical protein